MHLIIITQTFNRSKIAEISIKNLSNTKRKSDIIVCFDDGGDEDCYKAHKYANLLLKEGHWGIEVSRAKQFLKFAKTGMWLYFTDSDCIHDPVWRDIVDTNAKEDSILSLYHSTHHSLFTKDSISKSSRCPGISFLVPPNVVNKVAANLRHEPNFSNNCWDNKVSNLIGKCYTSQTSYVEHFGGGGLHNKSHDQDRAVNPTPWLVNKRKEILNFLDSNQ